MSRVKQLTARPTIKLQTEEKNKLKYTERQKNASTWLWTITILHQLYISQPFFFKCNFQFSPPHPNYQITPWNSRLLLHGEREKLNSHGVNSILMPVSVTIETCEWNPRVLMCEKQPSPPEKILCPLRLWMSYLCNWSLIKIHLHAHIQYIHTHGIVLI